MSEARAGLAQGEDGVLRCQWCEASPDYRGYHDEEWGFPVTDERRLFEKICLEGFQAGLSWLTILNKREAFRKGFANFEAEKVARFGDRRHRRACWPTPASCAIAARSTRPSTTRSACSSCAQEFGSLAAYAWGYEPDADDAGRKRLDARGAAALGTSAESIAMSKDLKKRGWSFVGPTTVYAFMQAMGLVNDHYDGCHAREVALRQRAEVRSRRADGASGASGALRPRHLAVVDAALAVDALQVHVEAPQAGDVLRAPRSSRRAAGGCCAGCGAASANGRRAG